MTVRRLEIKKEVYRDSITMLKISSELARFEGVIQAAAVMATQLNKKILGDIGFTGPDVDKARTDDMIIAIEATEQKFLDQALLKADELLSARAPTTSAGKTFPKTLDGALQEIRDANMVVISVPGQFAKREALNALNKGLNVFLFSSNVKIDDEFELKRLAISRNLLMMGPDCGTSIINNVVLGFGNVLNPGPVGIVSASGTGLQQVSTLLDSKGVGISQGIGTGGNDLSDRVGGLMMIEGIRLLDRDPQTKVIVLVSKPPSTNTAKKVIGEASKCSKPVIVNFLGSIQELIDGGNCVNAFTLDEAANLACKELGMEMPEMSRGAAQQEVRERVIASESERLAASQKYVRGLYSGGTLCYEAQIVVKPLLGEIASNAPLVKTMWVDGGAESVVGHTCVDMGAEEFVVGRAHPMIDYTLRKARILREARDLEVAVVLLDVLLGYGSNPDPASELASAISEAKRIASSDGRYLCVVASVIGTRGDPQGIENQERILRDVGVILEPSNAAAARTAAGIALREKRVTKSYEQ